MMHDKHPVNGWCDLKLRKLISAKYVFKKHFIATKAHFDYILINDP